MDEQWKAIPGYSGDYEVSDLGRVRSRKWRRWRILKPAPNGNGYLQVVLSTEGKPKTCRVHKLVAAAFLSPQPEGYEVNHKDAIKRHNNATNLEWVTHAENTAHAERMGLRNHPRGEQHGCAKLTDDQVIEMRQLHALGKTQRELARLFGISQTSAGQAVRRETWKHVATPQKGRVT